MTARARRDAGTRVAGSPAHSGDSARLTLASGAARTVSRTRPREKRHWAVPRAAGPAARSATTGRRRGGRSNELRRNRRLIRPPGPLRSGCADRRRRPNRADPHRCRPGRRRWCGDRTATGRPSVGRPARRQACRQGCRRGCCRERRPGCPHQGRPRRCRGMTRSVRPTARRTSPRPLRMPRPVGSRPSWPSRTSAVGRRWARPATRSTDTTVPQAARRTTAKAIPARVRRCPALAIVPVWAWAKRPARRTRQVIRQSARNQCRESGPRPERQPASYPAARRFNPATSRTAEPLSCALRTG